MEGFAKQHQDISHVQRPPSTTTTLSPLEPKKVDFSNCTEYLKTLDFRAPFGMWRWGNIDWKIAYHTLWRNERFNYMVKFNEPKLMCVERHIRGHGYDHSTLDYAKPPNIALYSQ